MRNIDIYKLFIFLLGTAISFFAEPISKVTLIKKIFTAIQIKLFGLFVAIIGFILIFI